MSKTKIEWTGHTWNPITGCTKISAGCKNCYAERMARRLAGRFGYPEQPHHFDVTGHQDKLLQPLGWRKPRMVFVCSMGDLFHEQVQWPDIERIFKVMIEARRHTFQILTKRAKRMQDFVSTCFHGLAECSPHIWLGVTVENQATADARRTDFEATPAAVKFVSYEPALGPIDWSGWEFVAQIISGGETGPGARPSHPDWHRAMRDFCLEHDIAYFFKQWGAWFPRSQWEDNPHLILPDDCECVEGRNLRIIDDDIMHRIGKKRAGHLLDGQTYREFPKNNKMQNERQAE